MTTTMTEAQASKALLFVCCKCGTAGQRACLKCGHKCCKRCEQAKSRKYKNQPCEMDGFKFDSLAEMARYGELKLLERAGKISGLIAGKKSLQFKLMVHNTLIGIYEADFSYVEKGRRVIEDVKGVRTPVYKLKRALMNVLYGIEIQEIG